MRIYFQSNYAKILETVLWILNKHKGINMYNLLKVLFHADLLSVNKYGVPVTGETYYAYQFGTVPENTYKGLINREPIYLEFFGLEEIPFEIKNKYFLYPKREAKEDYLSETDKECLEEGIKEYAFLTFEQVKDKNHNNEGWKKLLEILRMVQ